MPRALWKGAISFGLVHVPVELYPAAQRHSLDLDWLDKRTLEPIGYKKINKSTGKEVKSDQIVKGYEYEKGKYVVLGEEDFKRANPVATQTVEILAFIPEGEVPAEYFDTPYYLGPGRRGEKVYALLREAMKQAKRQALAHVVLQTKQHLALVYPQDRLLMLNTLRYADEIRASTGIELPASGAKGGGLKSNELKMALRLIEEMTERWDPAKYRDTYREDILKRVNAKVKAGETREAAEPEEEAAPARRKAEVIDLVALLRESVAKGGAAKPRRARKTTRARRARSG
jgi:DNA end-binding protein Ku